MKARLLAEGGAARGLVLRLRTAVGEPKSLSEPSSSPARHASFAPGLLGRECPAGGCGPGRGDWEPEAGSIFGVREDLGSRATSRLPPGATGNGGVMDCRSLGWGMLKEGQKQGFGGFVF